MSENEKTNCRKCKWIGDLPGSAHHCCRHPKLEGLTDDPMGNMLAVFASVRRTPPVVASVVLIEAFELKYDPHGLKMGWFNWPWNFDPVWLQYCACFTPKEIVKKQSDFQI